MIWASLLSFIIGIAILLASAQLFLQLMQALSAKIKFSPLFISMVVVGLGTNLPELVVTISALSRSDVGLAMGNLVGSSIVNLSLIFGLAVLAGSVRIGNNKTQKNAIMLFIISCLFVGLQQSIFPNHWQAVVLLLAMAVALTYDFVLAKKGSQHEDKSMLKVIETVQEKKRQYTFWQSVLFFLISLAGLVTGGWLTVSAVETLAVLWGISTTIIGLTLTALATSTPELITILLAEHDHEDKVVVGTLVGSNLFNLTLFPAIVLGFTSIKQLLPTLDLSLLIGIMILFTMILFGYKGKHIPRWLGLILVIYFVVFALLTTS